MLKTLWKHADEVVLIVLLAIMCIVLALQVFFRYVLSVPLTWSEELARYIFVWITFIGAGYGARRRLHIAMTFAFDRIPRTAQKGATIFTNVAAILAYSWIIPPSITFMVQQHRISATTFDVPLSVLFAAVPVGVGILILRLIEDTYRIIRNGNVRGDGA